MRRVLLQLLCHWVGSWIGEGTSTDYVDTFAATEGSKGANGLSGGFTV